MELVLNVSTTGVGDKKAHFVKNNKNLKDANCVLNNVAVYPENKETVDIVFENITLSTSLGWGKGKKKILQEISGNFLAGQFISIIGPSGAGKTSLLNVLSGYRRSGIGGAIYINNRPRKLHSFKKVSCYITFENHLQTLLSAWENMEFAFDLKLGLRKSPEQKRARIADILSSLCLDKCAHTKVDDLSNGEQKRLSIALELISDPSVIFFDEPTTGLDSFSSSRCLRLLHTLAQQGKTVISTIHQPSASLFQLFDQVYVLGEGKCVYQGSGYNVMSFLDHINLPCPIYHHPADYIIELACGNDGKQNIATMVQASKNGKCDRWLGKPKITSVSRKIDQQYQNISVYDEFTTLVRREFLKSKRDATLTYLRLIVNVIVAFLCGTIYWQTGPHAGKVRTNYNLLFCVLIHHTMSTMMLAILTFPSQLPIITKEHFNHWYSLKIYFASLTVAGIPVLLLSCLVFTSIVYLMTGQPLELQRVLIFTTTSFLLVLVVQTFGLLIGSCFNVLNGTFVAFAITIPMMMLAGFGETLKDLPLDMSWTSYLSYMRYSFNGILTAIYGLNRSALYCPEDEYCHYKYPKKILKDVLMHTDQFWLDVLGLCLIFVFYRLVTFFILKWKVENPR